LAIYQTDLEDLLKSEEYEAIETTNELLPEKEIDRNSELDGRNYELIQDFDPNGLGDSNFTSPF